MTALREAQEEIGLDPGRARVLGRLAPVFTVVSNYLIVPVVALLPEGLGELRLQESEVTELIVVPLLALAEPAIMHTEEWMRNGVARTVYFYDYGSYRIWGATARVLTSLLNLLA
jgi:8-oxo-dGTP pyrophosphatase MutT (NUDIX family)